MWHPSLSTHLLIKSLKLVALVHMKKVLLRNGFPRLSFGNKSGLLQSLFTISMVKFIFFLVRFIFVNKYIWLINIYNNVHTTVFLVWEFSIRKLKLPVRYCTSTLTRYILQNCPTESHLSLTYCWHWRYLNRVM